MESSPVGRRTAVITDSTASLPPDLAAAVHVLVVPLDVIIDDVAGREGVDVGPTELVTALERGASVSTAQPSPEAFTRAYGEAVAGGATEIVSVHLSAELSGTLGSAGLAARTAAVSVHVVDSRTVGLGLGFAVLAAARAADRGMAGPAVADVALRHALGSRVTFTVSTLEHLRRGGRLGAASAALGTLLGMRPVLCVRDGRIVVAEKIRTTARARARVEEWAVEEAGGRPGCVLGVQYLGDPLPARELAGRLRERLARVATDVLVTDVGAVVGAHAGPGLLAVVVADADAEG